MNEFDLNKVIFYSKEDLASGSHLERGERVLRRTNDFKYETVNDILELYNIKKYIDNEMYLSNWTQEVITDFKQKVFDYGKLIGRFFSDIVDTNIIDIYEKTLRQYQNSFWEIINDQKVYKRISNTIFKIFLYDKPHLINVILSQKNLVEHYNHEVANFLLTYSQSAEILISIYEIKTVHSKIERYVPKSLSIQDKENIISNYLDSVEVNLNYLRSIQNFRNSDIFRISDKNRLKAKKVEESKTAKIFAKNDGMSFGVSVNYPAKITKLKESITDGYFVNYSYSFDHIKQNQKPYQLFLNFIILFEYLDVQCRINLVSKKSQMTTIESVIGFHSQNEYRKGFAFDLSEMASHAQIISYNKVLEDIGVSLESILHYIFTTAFPKKYGFAYNARIIIPSAANSYFEKVRLLAPEFESLLKQFKLYVENGNIDFDLFQISSAPTLIKEIPSLNKRKHIYLDQNNKAFNDCSFLFFSDQTLLTHVDPFKEQHYRCFFDLLIKEKVNLTNYEGFQKLRLNYLIENKLISVDENNIIKIANFERVLILKDLHDNEVASFNHYPINFQKEVLKMEGESILFLESTLFSKPEQSYFNYFLNKSKYTNGLDLRNRYVHGTQANPEETQVHENAYFSYLKLLFLVLLKIDDDLRVAEKLKPN